MLLVSRLPIKEMESSPLRQIALSFHSPFYMDSLSCVVVLNDYLCEKLDLTCKRNHISSFFHQPTFFPHSAAQFAFSFWIILMTFWFSHWCLHCISFSLCLSSSSSGSVQSFVAWLQYSYTELHAYMKSRCVSDRVMILISLYSFFFCFALHSFNLFWAAKCTLQPHMSWPIIFLSSSSLSSISLFNVFIKTFSLHMICIWRAAADSGF